MSVRLRRPREIDIADVRREQDLERKRRHHRVPVRVDQPRHQHPSAAVDDLHFVADGRPGGLDRADPPVFDLDPEAGAQRVRPAVEDGGRWRRRDGLCAERASPRWTAGAGREHAAADASELPENFGGNWH